MLLSDEIYSRLIFEGSHFSPISIPSFRERTILLDGFSKTYAMTAGVSVTGSCARTWPRRLRV